MQQKTSHTNFILISRTKENRSRLPKIQYSWLIIRFVTRGEVSIPRKYSNRYKYQVLVTNRPIFHSGTRYSILTITKVNQKQILPSTQIQAKPSIQIQSNHQFKVNQEQPKTTQSKRQAQVYPNYLSSLTTDNNQNEIAESRRKVKPHTTKTPNSERPWQLTKRETSTRNESSDSLLGEKARCKQTSNNSVRPPSRTVGYSTRTEPLQRIQNHRFGEEDGWAS